MAGNGNGRCIQSVNTKMCVTNTQDPLKDNETDTLCNTGNFLSKLKTCIGARIMLTDNINIFDRLIYGSVKCINIINQSKPLNWIIYAQFNDP